MRKIAFCLFLIFIGFVVFAQENKYVVTVTYHIKQPEQTTIEVFDGDEYIVTINYTTSSSNSVTGRSSERNEVGQENVRAKSKEEAERVVNEKWRLALKDSSQKVGAVSVYSYVNSVSAVKKEPPAVSNLTSKYNILAPTATEAEEKAIKQWEALKEADWVLDFANAERANDIAPVNPPQQETPKENKYRVDIEFWHDNAPPVGRIRNTMSFTVNASTPEEAKKKAEAKYYAEKLPWWVGIISIKDPIKVD